MTPFENVIFAIFRILKSGDISTYGSDYILIPLLHTPNNVPKPLIHSGEFFVPSYPQLPNSCIIW